MATVFTHISIYIYTVYITTCFFVISINTWCALWGMKFLLTALFSTVFCLTTDMLKLVGKIRAMFQASFSNWDSANWPGYEAELNLFRHCKWDTDSDYVHTVTDSFCAGTKTIPDEASVHIYKKRWFRHNFCNGARLNLRCSRPTRYLECLRRMLSEATPRRSLKRRVTSDRCSCRHDWAFWYCMNMASVLLNLSFKGPFSHYSSYLLRRLESDRGKSRIGPWERSCPRACTS